MYCVKCKKQTETSNIQHVTTRNNRRMLRGNCVVCGKVKTQFTKSKEGGSDTSGAGFVNSLINKLPFEMHLPGHNFTGPGTKLNKRLNADLTPKGWSKPINRVDKAAYHHDLCYVQNKDTGTRNSVCDKSMISELKGIVNPSLREKLDKSIVERIINAKANFGMGYRTMSSAKKKS